MNPDERLMSQLIFVPVPLVADAGRRANDPTVDEIRQRCALVRAGWCERRESEAEGAYRASEPVTPFVDLGGAV